jgi:2-isopropylmalate synthase
LVIGFKSLAFIHSVLLIATAHRYGNGQINAFLVALGLDLWVHHYEERSLAQGSDAAAIAIIELGTEALSGTMHGVGIHANIVTASLRAILSAVNRATQVNSDLKQRLSQRFEKEPLPLLEH